MDSKPTKHPNLVKLETFVDVRLEAAKAMPANEAYWFLRRWAEHVEKQFARLGIGVHGCSRKMPEHLVGLRTADLIIAEGRLSSAAHPLRPGANAQVVA